MIRLLIVALALGAPSAAFAVCNPNLPNNPENDCDLDGCTVAQGDCADSLTVNPKAASIRGPGCPTGAFAEVCDGEDNNCSGAVDEGNPGSGAVCSTGLQGVCGPGVIQCVSGALSCVQNVQPSAEQCDGADNNCAGGVDEGNPGGGAACSTAQAGVCAAGTRTCVSGGLQCVRDVAPSAETCDGLDNNCMGGVDESFNVGSACTNGSVSGICRDGTNQCQPNGTAACISTVLPGTRTESCNGADDDCDGSTDEGNPGGGVGCSTGQAGVCAAGTTSCSGGALSCVRNTAPSAEICDGLDNNCAGGVDEGFSIGTVCTNTSASGVCRPGTTQCISTSATACVSNVLPGTRSETCNGDDDDCDGSTDEGNPGGGAVCSTGQAGVCGPGTTSCTSGAVQCVRNVAPSAEICDSLDNDCVNGVDDGLLIDADGDGSRACGTCRANASPNCDCNDASSAVRPGRTEVCNNVDDDCDGSTDENITRICYTGPPGTYTGTCPPTTLVTTCAPRGICQGASQTCTAGAFPACTPATLPQTGPDAVEQCNNLDDNCNGTVDEGLSGGACTTGELGVCEPGTERCAGGTLSCIRNVDAGPELCNNLDDDCNGVTDNNVPLQRCFTGPPGTYAGTCPGPSCTPRGECRAGSATCVSGTYGTCNGQTIPVPEVCDAFDNDCDGSNNNGLTVDADGDGSRACLTCGAPASPNCDCADNNTMVRPGLTELCDAIDNNCNGSTDEGSGPGGKLTANCYSGPSGTQGVGECVAGVRVCNATVPGMSSYGACMGEVVPATVEVCNGKDDDCDGIVDNGFDQDGDGFFSCAACTNLTNCDCNDTDPAIKPGAVENCDTVDQNCDGHLDDMPSRRCFAGANVTPDTYTGTCPGPTCQPKGACMAGTQACSAAGAWGTCAGVTLPSNEPSQAELSCNGLDDDCDGTVDDGSFDLDMDMVSSCAGDCDDNDSAVKPGLPESCDNKDNNCDGTIDGISTNCYEGPSATRGLGLCRDGTQSCVNGVGVGACTGGVLPALLPDGGYPLFVPDGGLNDPEILCDGKDEDCDGIVDDGYDLDHDGVTTCAGDCDDNDPFNKPGLPEVCDCQDNNCNTLVDDTADGGSVCRGAPCHDFDADGITNCAGDCDDSNAAIGPQQSERVGNGRDDDCDGAVDEDTDEDGDNYSTAQGDCDDRVASINPGAAEVCDGFDNDCDGLKDEGFDQDNDFATVCAGDCDDTDPTRSPFRREICGSGKDENCDGRIDEDTDADGDGVTTCEGDCNDFNGSVHPGTSNVGAAMEVCDGQDNDCNGQTDEGFDIDQDNVATCFGDCNDMDPQINPNIYEIAGNSKDDNCNGRVDEGADDRDNDGFTAFCGDCNDADPNINPHVKEMCDRVDNNCDAYIDSAPNEFNLCAVCFDADQDGQTNCDGDCNDADPSIRRGAPELCDLKDNDCDGDTDLDPATGLRVCTNDGGLDSDGGLNPGETDGGANADGGTGPGQPIDGDGGRPRVTTSCGCSSPADLAPLAFLTLIVLGRRARRSTLKRIPVLSVLTALALTSCSTSFETPGLPDGSIDGEGDGGSQNDGGVDAGFRPPQPQWPCPDFYPVEHVMTYVPSTAVAFAHSLRYAVTELAPAQMVLFDDGPANFAGFVLRRPVPSDVNVEQPDALNILAGREIAALQSLAGSPLVRDRIERFNRVYLDELEQKNASHGSTLTFATATTPFSVRNRLATALSGKTVAEVGTLPVGPQSAAAEQLVVYLLFRITQTDVFIAGAVSTVNDFSLNQPALADFTNGTHLSDPSPVLDYTCEVIQSPPLKTDFIFVVDSSASMLEEQAALASSADALFAAFQRSGIDFRIGVVTTDSDVLRGNGFTNELAQFKNNVRVGINGNGLEMGIEFGLRAIRRARMMPLIPDLQIRDDAGLVVVFVSDEENTGLKSVAEYAADFIAENAVTFGIVGQRPSGCTRVGLGNAVAGTQYIDLSAATGGSTGSICNPNITEVVEEILFGAIGASSRAKLGSRPISGSLATKTSMSIPRARMNGFDYDPGNNTLLFFGTSPPTGTDVTTAYATFLYLQ